MTRNAKLALLLPWLAAVILWTPGCGSVRSASKVFNNAHDEVVIDYRRGAEIEGMPEATPNDYEIKIRIRGQIKPGNEDPLSGLGAAGMF